MSQACRGLSHVAIATTFLVLAFTGCSTLKCSKAIEGLQSRYTSATSVGERIALARDAYAEMLKYRPDSIEYQNLQTYYRQMGNRIAADLYNDSKEKIESAKSIDDRWAALGEHGRLMNFAEDAALTARLAADHARLTELYSGYASAHNLKLYRAELEKIEKVIATGDDLAAREKLIENYLARLSRVYLNSDDRAAIAKDTRTLGTELGNCRLLQALYGALRDIENCLGGDNKDLEVPEKCIRGCLEGIAANPQEGGSLEDLRERDRQTLLARAGPVGESFRDFAGRFDAYYKNSDSIAQKTVEKLQEIFDRNSEDPEARIKDLVAFMSEITSAAETLQQVVHSDHLPIIHKAVAVAHSQILKLTYAVRINAYIEKEDEAGLRQFCSFFVRDYGRRLLDDDRKQVMETNDAIVALLNAAGDRSDGPMSPAPPRTLRPTPIPASSPAPSMMKDLVDWCKRNPERAVAVGTGLVVLWKTAFSDSK